MNLRRNTSVDIAVDEGKRRKGLPMPLIMVIIIIIAYVTIFLLVVDFEPRDDRCDAFIADLMSVSGSFGPRDVQGPTSATIEFGKITCDPSPVKLMMILEMNGTGTNRYYFQSNEDGALLLTQGKNVGNLTYEDVKDNGRVNEGFWLVMTDLKPGSDYVIRLVIEFTGDGIATESFSTPTG